MNPTIHVKGFRRLSATVLCSYLASIFAALPAAHAEDIDVPQARVTFSDLDLSRPQGAAVLYSRIRAAAEKVCSVDRATTMMAKVRISNCVRTAIAEAVSAVDQPALTQVYSAKNRMPLPSRLSAQASKVKS